MDRENIAEWCLRRVVAPDRASELIGDQLEAHPAMGMLPFWFAIGRLLLAFAWRTVLGVVITPAVGTVVGWYVFAALSSQLRSRGYDPAENQRMVEMFCLIASMLFWGAAAFSLVRFGYRSALTRLVVLVACLASASTCFSSLPSGKAGLLVALAVVLVASLSNAVRRRALAVMALTLASTLLVAYCVESVSVLWFVGLRTRYPMPFLYGALLLLSMAGASAASFFHRKLLASHGYDRHASV